MGNNLRFQKNDKVKVNQDYDSAKGRFLKKGEEVTVEDGGMVFKEGNLKVRYKVKTADGERLEVELGAEAGDDEIFEAVP
ncbi:hypothetical protein ACFL54_08445 [Planctomycetota bacterium]